MDHVGAPAIRAAIEAARALLGAGFVAGPAPVPEDFAISGPSTAVAPRDGTLVFLRAVDGPTLERLRLLRGLLLILPKEAEREASELSEAGAGIVLRAAEPKYAYALLASEFWPLASWRGGLTRDLGNSSWAAADAVIGEGAVIEPFVTIGRGSRIGARCIILRGASIGPSVEMDDDCLVRENAVVGDLGFGFAFSPGLPPRRLPQVGGVRLGRRVEIGALSTVGAGTIEPTVVGADTKISDHVHIAHNVKIGSSCVVACGVSVSGSAVVGDGVWLSPGAVVRNKVRVGDGATVGLGAVVVGDVAERVTVAGLPARPLAKHVDPRE